MSIRAPALCALAALILASPAGAQDIIGTATVIDGDTLRIGATTIRLYGIDAPEKRQTCRSADGTIWQCGLAAWTRLEALTLDHKIACHRTTDDSDQPIPDDRYGRMIAICGVVAFGRISRPSLNARLVEEGLAIAYRRYSDMFESEEFLARRERLGIWRGQFDPPEAWRHRRKARSRP